MSEAQFVVGFATRYPPLLYSNSLSLLLTFRFVVIYALFIGGLIKTIFKNVAFSFINNIDFFADIIQENHHNHDYSGQITNFECRY